METKFKAVRIGYLEVKFTSDYYNGEKLDTIVNIGEQHLCTIAGCQIDDFIKDLKTIIDDYRI